MNTKLWGPVMWNIMTDVAYKTDRSADRNICKYVTQFYQVLAFLLPCKYCRQSYRKYLCELDVVNYTNQKKCIEWIWKLKEKVNDKLKKPPEDRLSYPLFLKKVNFNSHCGSVENVWDMLSIFALNYDSGSRAKHSDDHLKKKYMIMLHALLPIVLPYASLAQFFQQHSPFQVKILDSKQTYMHWLYTMRKKYNQQYNKQCNLPVESELWKRYQNVKAEQKTPIICQYVIP